MTRSASVLLALCLAACHHTTVIGSSVACQTDGDCAPPETVCSADGRCVPGCANRRAACVGGATCNPATGECEGGTVVGMSCSTDGDCEPPDVICKTASKQCVAGCDLDPTVCYGGWICDYATGRCCDPKYPDCRVPAGGGCNSDGDCAPKPDTVCMAGTCAPGCAQSGCTAPMLCAPTGHCGPAGGVCARDADCDGASACSHAGSCVVLADGGAIGCAGGTQVYSSCNQPGSPSTWASCVGAPGPPGCPYCFEGSCFHAGLCSTPNDCHGGDDCVAGLCRPSAPECPTIVTAAEIVGGGFAAGHEVCVQGRVSAASDELDGNVLVHLGSSPGVYAEITAPYLAAGVSRPSVGDTITVHGTVRWDQSHSQWEILPIDWWSR
jgi:hypothetical protein